MRTAHGCEAAFSRSRHAAASGFLFLLAALATADVVGDDPAPSASPSPTLSQQIDLLLESSVPQLVAVKESDGSLLRRLSLDLRGVVPTREELDAFAADDSTERWTNWVDKFLQDPLCDEHLVTFLDRTLMLRRAYSASTLAECAASHFHPTKRRY